MFLHARLKSKNPEVRLKAIREKAMQAWPDNVAIYSAYVEFARAEKDIAMQEKILDGVGDTDLLFSLAASASEEEGFRVAALRTAIKLMRSRIDFARQSGDRAEQGLLDALHRACESLASSSSSATVCAVAREGLTDPMPPDLDCALANETDHLKVIRLLLAEREPERIERVASHLEQMPAPKDLSELEGTVALALQHRDNLPSESIRRLVDTYARWSGTNNMDVRLKFTTLDDLERLTQDLEGSDAMKSIQALKKLQELYRMGKYRQEISRLTYRGQSVPTYRDRNAGSMVV